MNIEKIELKERAFIPYKIVITIDNASEHRSLKDDLRTLKSENSGRWYEIHRKLQSNTLYRALLTIESHL